MKITDGKIPFSGYTLLATKNGLDREIIFYKDGYKFFTIDSKKGIVPQIVSPNLKKFNAAFCDLVERANQNSANLIRLENQY